MLSIVTSVIATAAAVASAPRNFVCLSALKADLAMANANDFLTVLLVVTLVDGWIGTGVV